MSAVTFPELLTTAQAAERLGLRPQTLINARATGRFEIPFYRMGNRVKYSAEDLQTFLESKRVTA